MFFFQDLCVIFLNHVAGSSISSSFLRNMQRKTCRKTGCFHPNRIGFKQLDKLKMAKQYVPRRALSLTIKVRDNGIKHSAKTHNTSTMFLVIFASSCKLRSCAGTGAAIRGDSLVSEVTCMLISSSCAELSLRVLWLRSCLKWRRRNRNILAYITATVISSTSRKHPHIVLNSGLS